MPPGAFSVSLAVKDLEASRAFDEKSGFAAFAGNAAQNWLILKNGDHVIGLFQGLFEKHIPTFNSGWDSNAQTLDADVPDVDALYARLRPRLERLPAADVEPPLDKPWNQREFQVRLPDGDWLTFGQPVRGPSPP